MHVPGWHERTRKLQDDGRIQMLGILQEQHPDRARLFMQWKEMGWPLMVDSLDLLDVGVVPLTVLIDERGVVFAIRPDTASFDAFLATSPGDAQLPTPSHPAQPDRHALQAAAKSGRAADLSALADAAFLWGGEPGLDTAIDLYRRARALDPDEGRASFRLGVAYRRRYDTSIRRDGDFAAAVAAWGEALDADPNQYIWRRRIQQYGPRLNKPYPFYDWVATARAQIIARRETPVALEVEPHGAEIARPARTFEAAAADAANPDPAGRIQRDEEGFVTIEQTVVPASIEAGAAARVHLVMRPDPARRAHWNNEAEEMVVWVEPPTGWSVDARRITVPGPPEAVSEEVREVEFECRVPKNASGTVSVPAYALYYVCEGVHGACLYRRQDIPVVVQVRSR
ncbi:MAG: hypothetical protein ACE5IK_03500 [Acidobacteriota bacterium]